jgi:hypothetical protein
MDEITLEKQVEDFLSKADIILFESAVKNIVMGLHFAEERFDIFKEKSNYENFNNYFEGER